MDPFTEKVAEAMDLKNEIGINLEMAAQETRKVSDRLDKLQRAQAATSRLSLVCCEALVELATT